MRVLVTGVAGFIGSATALMLANEGYEVVGIDDFSSGNEENVPRGIKFLCGDFSDKVLLQDIGRIDSCIHFAGRIEAGESMKVPERFLVENVAKSQVLLESVLQMGCLSFVFSSSAAVYGQSDLTSLTENAPTVPSSAYGFTKLVIEQSLEWLHKLRGLRYASLRYFNAAGAMNGVAESHRPETHLIPLILNSITSPGLQIPVYGNDYPTNDGTCVRDYVHVSDLARAHVLALKYLDKNERIVVNVGSGEGKSVLDVIREIETVTGHKINFYFTDRREGDPAYLIANISLAQELLSWTPAESKLNKIVADAWETLSDGTSL